jgi:hypothetical protein
MGPARNDPRYIFVLHGRHTCIQYIPARGSRCVYTCITVLGVTKTSFGTVALAVVCLFDCTLCMLGGQPEMTHGIFGTSRETHVPTVHLSSWQVVYTRITVFGVTKTSCVTVAPAVGGISDYTLCVLGVQPEMIQGIFSYFTGDTRGDSTSQLVAGCIHTHHSVWSYQNKLCNRCTCGGWHI